MAAMIRPGGQEQVAHLQTGFGEHSYTVSSEMGRLGDDLA